MMTPKALAIGMMCSGGLLMLLAGITLLAKRAIVKGASASGNERLFERYTRELNLLQRASFLLASVLLAPGIWLGMQSTWDDTTAITLVSVGMSMVVVSSCWQLVIYVRYARESRAPGALVRIGVLAVSSLLTQIVAMVMLTLSIMMARG